MGLFGKIVSGIMKQDKNSRPQEDIDFENQVRSDGVKHAGKRIADILNEKITSQDLARQFVLEELDAARQGNDFAQSFVKSSGFKSFEYVGAINKTKWEGDESELEFLQLFLRGFLIKISDVDLIVKLSTTVVDEIMKRWGLGKYKSNANQPVNLENRLNNILLSNEMQSKMYNEARNLKYYGDKFFASQSKEDAIAYQQSVIQAVNSTIEIYEWLNKKDIFELNGLIILGSFYLINLSDISFKDPAGFSDVEITNMIGSFLAALGVQEQPDISSYNGLIRICINWLLKHPMG